MENTNRSSSDTRKLHLEELKKKEKKKSVEAKMELHQSNMNLEHPDMGLLRTLNSSIKQNTATIKKLKEINKEHQV